MTICKKIDGVWTPLRGRQVLERQATTRTVLHQYADGRVENAGEESCDPYPVQDEVSISKIESLLDEGVWTKTDLEPYGLKRAKHFEVPEGRHIVGALTITEDSENNPIEQYQTEEIPPARVLSTEEKLAQAGLGSSELDAYIESYLSRREGATIEVVGDLAINADSESEANESARNS